MLLREEQGEPLRSARGETPASELRCGNALWGHGDDLCKYRRGS